MFLGFLNSLYLTLYKTDISLSRTLSAGPEGVRLRESFILYNKLTTVFHGLYENPSIRMTQTRFYEPARLNTPHKPLFSLQPLDATTWLRSLLSKVLRYTQSALSNMDTLWTGTMCKSESGVRLIENKDQFRPLGNCPPTPPLSQHKHLLLI